MEHTESVTATVSFRLVHNLGHAESKAMLKVITKLSLAVSSLSDVLMKPVQTNLGYLRETKRQGASKPFRANLG